VRDKDFDWKGFLAGWVERIEAVEQENQRFRSLFLQIASTSIGDEENLREFIHSMLGLPANYCKERLDDPDLQTRVDEFVLWINSLVPNRPTCEQAEKEKSFHLGWADAKYLVNAKLRELGLVKEEDQ
jgi:hypothetical protein